MMCGLNRPAAAEWDRQCEDTFLDVDDEMSVGMLKLICDVGSLLLSGSLDVTMPRML